MEERAPWYIVAGRIIMFLSITGISYAFLFFHICVAIVVYDAITSMNLQSIVLNLCDKYPIGSIAVTVIGYIIWTISLMIATVERLAGRK